MAKSYTTLRFVYRSVLLCARCKEKRCRLPGGSWTRFLLIWCQNTRVKHASSTCNETTSGFCYSCNRCEQACQTQLRLHTLLGMVTFCGNSKRCTHSFWITTTWTSVLLMSSFLYQFYHTKHELRSKMHNRKKNATSALCLFLDIWSLALIIRHVHILCLAPICACFFEQSIAFLPVLPGVTTLWLNNNK